jgi:hypothetical protein
MRNIMSGQPGIAIARDLSTPLKFQLRALYLLANSPMALPPSRAARQIHVKNPRKRALFGVVFARCCIPLTPYHHHH